MELNISGYIRIVNAMHLIPDMMMNIDMQSCYILFPNKDYE